MTALTIFFVNYYIKKKNINLYSLYFLLDSFLSLELSPIYNYK